MLKRPKFVVKFYGELSQIGIALKSMLVKEYFIYTEQKPSGRHYLGVTRTTMSSAVQTVTLMEAGVSIVAMVVYNCC